MVVVAASVALDALLRGLLLNFLFSHTCQQHYVYDYVSVRYVQICSTECVRVYRTCMARDERGNK